MSPPQKQQFPGIKGLNPQINSVKAHGLESVNLFRGQIPGISLYGELGIRGKVKVHEKVLHCLFEVHGA